MWHDNRTNDWKYITFYKKNMFACTHNEKNVYLCKNIAPYI